MTTVTIFDGIGKNLEITALGYPASNGQWHTHSKLTAAAKGLLAYQNLADLNTHEPAPDKIHQRMSIFIAEVLHGASIGKSAIIKSS